jgi:hypothetical protein
MLIEMGALIYCKVGEGMLFKILNCMDLLQIIQCFWHVMLWYCLNIDHDHTYCIWNCLVQKRVTRPEEM